MNGPGFYKGKKPLPPPAAEFGGLKWVPLWTLAGGLTAAFAALQFHQRDLGLGLGWGSLLVSLNYFSLKVLTERVLARNETEAKKYFWFWNSVRWFFLATACWLFLRVSPLCLGGAGVSYFWFLLVLGWAGWRSASSGKEPLSP
jgi:hypothetical protein